MHTFSDWLALKLGTRKWVVAPRLTDRLRDKGHDLAVSQRSFTALKQEYAALPRRP